jgi:hypothetical protein
MRTFPVLGMLVLIVGAATTAAPGRGQPAASDRTAVPPEPTRIAVVTLGTPGEEGGSIGESIGKEILAEDFERVVPMLEKERVDIVVVRVNSGLCEGPRAAAETARLVELFTKEYKPRFRTVAWIESAIDAPAVAVWPLDELYFMPQGNMGAAVLTVDWMKVAEGEELAAWLKLGEEASRASGRDPKIMRAMQAVQPLSATTDGSGDIEWFADLSGERVVNKAGRVLTLDSRSAETLKISHATVGTKEELARAMGVADAAWVGDEAAATIRDAVAQRRDEGQNEKDHQDGR